MKIKKYLPYLLIVLCGLVYTPALNNPFVWDDVVIIQDNPFIGSPARLKAKNFINAGDYFNVSKEGTYRPVATLFYYFTGIVSLKNPAGYRAVNVLLNIAAGILVMLLAGRFWGSRAGLLGGLLFVLHPIHSETVFIASFNEDIIMTVFLLGAFLAHINYRKTGNKLMLFFSATSFLFSCLAKEPGLAFLGFVVFYEEFSGNRREEEKGNKWAAYLTYSLAALVYAGLRFIPASKSALPPTGEIIRNIVTRGMPSLFEYARLTAFPFDFQIDRIPVFTLFNVVAGLFLTGWLAYFAFFKYRKEVGLWAVFFLLPLLPVLNIIPFYFYPVIGERYLYLPSVGVCVIAGMVLSKWNSAAIRNLTMLSVLVLFAITIFQRSSDYRNNLEFWKKAVASSPMSFMAHNSLGNEYKRLGDFQKAEIYYAKAIEIKPDYAEAYVNMGSVLGLRKDYKQAEKFYKEAMSINPALSKSYSGLAVVYMWQGELQKAESLFKKSVELDGSLLGAYHFLGQIYEKQGRLKEAMAMRGKILEFDPRNITELNNLGLLAARTGEYDKSLECFQRAINADPKYPDALINLGNVYFMKGKYARAQECYLRALEISPDSALVKSNLERVNMSLRTPPPFGGVKQSRQ